jgi:hypothetical protein
LFLVAGPLLHYVAAMSRVEELERVIEQLPREDFEKLSSWMAQRRAECAQGGRQPPLAFRDHRAFLNSYGSEDEGLYDDAAGR